MKRRGRPRRDDDAILHGQDELIGRTVSQLLWWGFPARRRVYPTVARLARVAIGRQDHAGRALSAARVEQIYETWLIRQEAPNFARRPGRYATESLRMRVPDKAASLEQLASTLLANAGVWPTDSAAAPHGDASLTPAAQAQYLREQLPIKTG